MEFMYSKPSLEALERALHGERIKEEILNHSEFIRSGLMKFMYSKPSLEALERALYEERIKEEILIRRLNQRRMIEEEVRRQVVDFGTTSFLFPPTPLAILPPIPHEETGSNVGGSEPVPVAVSKKRKAEAAETTASKQLWSCALCAVSTTSEDGLKSHINGKRHKAKAAEPAVDATDNVRKNWSCGLCTVTTTSEDGLKSHLSGKRHKANAREAELALSLNEATTEAKTAEADAMERGPSDRKMVRMKVDGVLNWVAEESNYFLCEVCDFKSSKDVMVSHLYEEEHCEALAKSVEKK